MGPVTRRKYDESKTNQERSPNGKCAGNECVGEALLRGTGLERWCAPVATRDFAPKPLLRAFNFLSPLHLTSSSTLLSSIHLFLNTFTSPMPFESIALHSVFSGFRESLTLSTCFRRILHTSLLSRKSLYVTRCSTCLLNVVCFERVLTLEAKNAIQMFGESDQREQC